MHNFQPNINLNKISRPTLKEAKNLFIVSLLLVAIWGGWIQKYNFWLGLLFTEILFILLPTIIFIVNGRFSFKLVLRLNYPGSFALFIGVLLGICIWPLSLWIHLSLLNLFSSESQSILNVISEIRDSNLFYRLIVMGIFASICEEMLFRGFVQTSIENKLGVKQSIIWTAILFSVFHLIPTSMIAIFPNALLMGWISWKFNSIFPAILIHFSNNFFAPYLFILYKAITLNSFYLLMIVDCLILIFIILMLTNKKIISKT